MEKIDDETQKKIQNLQALEQSFQSFYMQKQNFQIELNEVSTAIEEVKKSKSDVFRVLGQVMVKADKAKLEKELTDKKALLQTRLTSIEKQEKSLRQDIERLRGEIVEKMH